MLGGVSRGPILPQFELLKEAGFEGVELISPNKLDRDEVLAARDKTGLVIHGVSGSRALEETRSPTPTPRSSRRGLAAIRQEIEDCKAYGGTTVLRRPRRGQQGGLLPRRLHPVAGQHPQADPRRRAGRRSRSPSRRSGTSSSSAPLEFARYIDEFESPWVGAYFDVGNVVEYGYPQEWIRELGKRILKIHIKEYAKPKRFDYPLGEGRDRLARRPPGPHRRRLRGLDHRRGPPRRPRGHEGRRPADGQDPRDGLTRKGPARPQPS